MACKTLEFKKFKILVMHSINKSIKHLFLFKVQLQQEGYAEEDPKVTSLYRNPQEDREAVLKAVKHHLRSILLK